MKILITKEQKQHLSEQELIGYTPEKIETFVQQGLKELAHFQQQYQKYYTQMLNITINDVFDNINGTKSLVDEIKAAEVKTTQLSEKYYTIVEKYDYLDFPPNVKKLDDVYSGLETLSYDIGEIKDIVEGLYDSITHFIKWNKNKDQQINKIDI